MKLQLVFFASLLLCGACYAATISGTAYEWDTMQPLPYAILEINTTPKQTIVADDGSYSFGVPDGNYMLRAQYFEDNKLRYEASENVVVQGDGNFSIDLIMLPALGDDDFLVDDFNELTTGVNFDAQPGAAKNDLENIWPALILPVVALCLVLWGAGKLRGAKSQKFEEPMQEPRGSGIETPAFAPKKEAPAQNGSKDLDGIVEILGKYGGRMTQKELREKTDLGEAKLSLMVAELEQLGKIKKFKKGRGNIIVLKQ